MCGVYVPVVTVKNYLFLSRVMLLIGYLVVNALNNASTILSVSLARTVGLTTALDDVVFADSAAARTTGAGARHAAKPSLHRCQLFRFVCATTMLKCNLNKRVCLLCKFSSSHTGNQKLLFLCMLVHA